MKGWKTWGAAALIGVVAAGKYVFPEYAEFFDMLLKLGLAFGLVGVGHKIEKARR